MFMLAVTADPCTEAPLLKTAARLAVDHNLPFAETPTTAAAFELLLVATPTRLELRARDDAGKPFAVDLSKLDVTSAAGRSLKQPLAKALGIKRRSDPPPVVIDATAGWGEDSWLMLAFGCTVLLVERHPAVATLLRDGLLRAGVTNPQMLGRAHVVISDSRHLLRRLSKRDETDAALPSAVAPFLQPDVVYLDPMYPGHAQRKTAERKPLRLLRELVGADDDAAELLHWARQVAGKRVIVKRPTKAAPLAEAPPTMSYAGKSLRFDVYVRM